MKRIIISILILIGFSFVVFAQNDVMFVYRNDGGINAFLKAEIDSIRYSHTDLDSVEHREIIMQEVWTADSTYRIPLSSIDSVSFVPPPTIFKSDVIKIDDQLLDYVISCDSLTLKLKTSIPIDILPQSGEKLVLLDREEVLPDGFSGKVIEVNHLNDGIYIVCEQVYLEDLFDSFCSVTTLYGYEDGVSSYVTSGGPKRVTLNSDDVIFNLGPYHHDYSNEVSFSVSEQSDLAFKGEKKIAVTVTPTVRLHSLLIIGEGHGTYFNCSMTGNVNIESIFSLFSGIKYSKDIELNSMASKIAIPYTANCIHFYFVPGFFGKMDAIVTSNYVESRTYTFSMGYEFSSIGESLKEPTYGIRQVSSSTEYEGCLEGSIATGAFVETGFDLVSREIAKVYLRGELGWQLSGNYVTRNSDIVASEKNTELYEKLLASSIETGPFVNLSLGATLLQGNLGDLNVNFGDNRTMKKWNIVPTFSNTSISRSINSSTIEANTELSGVCISPIKVGFMMFDENHTKVADYDHPNKYPNVGSRLNYSFKDIEKNKKYIVYPKVQMFGFDILASPPAKLDEENQVCPDENHFHAIDLGLPSGTLWSCCNVGASSPEEYGGYYAWGETSEKTYYSKFNYDFYDNATEEYMNIGSNISGTKYDVARVNMGEPWQMPTYEQIKELQDYCVWEKAQLKGVSGMLVTGPNGGQIFLPASGAKAWENLFVEGTNAYFWCGSYDSNEERKAITIGYYPDGWGVGGSSRDSGLSVRPVCIPELSQEDKQ